MAAYTSKPDFRDRHHEFTKSKKYSMLVTQARQVAETFYRPISRKYDKAEHAYPKELDMLASLLDGMNEGADESTGATSASKRPSNDQDTGNKNGGNLSALLGVMELCYGDITDCP